MLGGNSSSRAGFTIFVELYKWPNFQFIGITPG